MADIFISYKREERAHAAMVAQALSEEGYSAFYDLHEDGIHAGEQWDKRLERELEAAHCCVVLWSAASVESDNVRSEARRANQRGILVPAKIDACTPPIGLDNLQEADLRTWRGDRADAQWRYLVDRGVARKLSRPRILGAATVQKAEPRTLPPPRRASEEPSTAPQWGRWVFGAGAATVIIALVWQPWRSSPSTDTVPAGGSAISTSEQTTGLSAPGFDVVKSEDVYYAALAPIPLTATGETISLTLEMPSEDAVIAARQKLPEIRAEFSGYLDTLLPAELTGSGPRFRLRLELERRANLIIAPHSTNRILIESGTTN